MTHLRSRSLLLLQQKNYTSIKKKKLYKNYDDIPY